MLSFVLKRMPSSLVLFDQRMIATMLSACRPILNFAHPGAASYPPPQSQYQALPAIHRRQPATYQNSYAPPSLQTDFPQ
jgi:hypothetical protein